MDKDTLQKAKELERDVKSITRILEEHDKTSLGTSCFSKN